MAAVLPANPLGTQEEPGIAAGPCVMVVFGASGDLTARKLIPALYNLLKARLLPRSFAVLGVAHDDLSEADFRTKAMRFLSEEDRNSDDWNWFSQRLYYLRGDFADAATFSAMDTRLQEIDTLHGTGSNYLFYMATLPRFFALIVEQLGRAG